MTRKPQLSSAARQRGVILVVGLIVLLVLTLLAVGSMRSTTLEERMTNNTQDAQIAFQVAEAALREAELLVQQPTLPSFTNTNGLYTYDGPDPESPGTSYVPLWERSSTQWRDASVTADAPPEPIGSARGQFIIEQMLVQEELSPGESLSADRAVETSERVIFRVTARAWGATGASNPSPMVILQSTFKR